MTDTKPSTTRREREAAVIAARAERAATPTTTTQPPPLTEAQARALAMAERWERLATTYTRDRDHHARKAVDGSPYDMGEHSSSRYFDGLATQLRDCARELRSEHGLPMAERISASRL